MTSHQVFFGLRADTSVAKQGDGARFPVQLYASDALSAHVTGMGDNEVTAKVILANIHGWQAPLDAEQCL